VIILRFGLAAYTRGMSENETEIESEEPERASIIIVSDFV
jgi:hypothetical protein